MARTKRERPDESSTRVMTLFDVKDLVHVIFSMPLQIPGVRGLAGPLANANAALGIMGPTHAGLRRSACA